MAWPAQAFIFSKELLDSVSTEEAEATFADMRELGIAKPPYERFDVILPVCKIIRVIDKEDPNDEGHMADDDPSMILRVRFEGYIEPSSPASFQWLLTRKGTTVDLLDYVLRESKRFGRLVQTEQWAISASMVYQLLVVLLATRNAIKETKECKLLKLGIGKKARNRYTTTIKIGAVTESAEPRAPGTEKRPHLRRGHVRRQHYGPHNELIKSIFIQPVFVNADKGWIAERTAYNLI